MLPKQAILWAFIASAYHLPLVSPLAARQQPSYSLHQFKHPWGQSGVSKNHLQDLLPGRHHAGGEYRHVAHCLDHNSSS
jgi:hypothetical protein